MYAIVDIAGQQFKVEKDQKIYVHRLSNKEGEQVHFEKVLLIDNEGKVSIGEPVLKNAAVVGKVMEHMKGDKVKVFKKKRRKGYQKLNGHRQFLTQILIEDIQEKATAKASKPKAETTPAVEDKETVKEKKDVKVEPKVETKTTTKAAAKTETKATPKTAAKAPKKPETPKAEKKTEAKKTTTKATASKKEGAKKKDAPASAAKKKAEDSDTKKESKE